MPWISYIRVSTSQQGDSGLGLAAQKDVVMRFIGNESLLAEFTEIESGRRHKNRPQLLAALELCKKKKATLVIAKLDRLSRNVAFISSLMESGVDFVCCDMPNANRFMLHVHAAFAEHERQIISDRIRAAFARIRAELAEKGSRVSKAGRIYTKLGGPYLQEARAKAAAIKRALRPPEYAMQLMSRMRTEGHTLRAIAATLNDMEIRTPQGFRWYASTVRSALTRNTEITKARNDGNTMGRKNDIVISTSRLNHASFPATCSFMASNAGREAIQERGHMGAIDEAQRMLDVFTSVGARSFFVTKLDILQNKLWAKSYTAPELQEKVPYMVRTAAITNLMKLSETQTIAAGENLIVRPTGPNVTLAQLDDLKGEQLDRIKPASFLILETSPSNYQAWIAVSPKPYDKEAEKDIVRRIRKAVGETDKSASGATRIAGTINWKVKYAPEFPTVTITHAVPGRVMSEAELSRMGLIAAPEPLRIPVSLTPITSNNRPWPSYAICLERAPMKKDGTPDRSRADLAFSLTALTGGKGIEETIAKLNEVSDRAKERARSDPGYARVTVENAARFVAQNYGKNRSRA